MKLDRRISPLIEQIEAELGESIFYPGISGRRKSCPACGIRRYAQQRMNAPSAGQ